MITQPADEMSTTDYRVFAVLLRSIQGRKIKAYSAKEHKILIMMFRRYGEF